MQIAELHYSLDDSIMTMRTLRFRVGPSDVCIFMDQAAGKIGRKNVVPGFRKGKAPLFRVRQHYREQVEAMAFSELKRAAYDQVLKQLKDTDQPFVPPRIEDEDKIRVRYAEPLEFAAKYLVDPAGVGKNPEQPQPFDPLGQSAQSPQARQLPMGIPQGPKPPSIDPKH